MTDFQSDDRREPLGAAGLRTHYSDVRKRLAGAGQGPSSQGEPSDLRALVADVATLVRMTPSAVLSDLTTAAVRGRRMVVALAVRRLGLGVPQAAAHFVVPQAFVTDALRTLDGVLTRIGASAVHAPIGPLLARMTGEWERFERPVHEGVTVADVQRAVARVFGISIADLISPRKSRDLVTPRHIAIYLARRFTLGSMPSIGRAFGGRHHTTAINAVERIEPFGKAVAARLPLDATLPDWARALRDEMTNDCRDASAGGAAVVSSSVRAGSPAIKSQTGSRQSQT